MMNQMIFTILSQRREHLFVRFIHIYFNILAWKTRRLHYIKRGQKMKLRKKFISHKITFIITSYPVLYFIFFHCPFHIPWACILDCCRFKLFFPLAPNAIFVCFYGANYSISRRLSVFFFFPPCFSLACCLLVVESCEKGLFMQICIVAIRSLSRFWSGLVFNILINYFTARVTFFSFSFSFLCYTQRERETPLLVLIMAFVRTAALPPICLSTCFLAVVVKCHAISMNALNAL